MSLLDAGRETTLHFILYPNAEANYTIHTFPQESAKCGDKIKAYISCFHLQLNPSFPFFRDI